MNNSRQSPSRKAAFHNAFAGWRYVLHSQPNARIHTLASLAVVALAWWLRLGLRDWAFLVFAMGLVWFAELTNTALEVLIDLTSPEIHPLARTSKDVSAAAVVAAAATAAAIGFLIIGPPLLARIRAYLDIIKSSG